MIPYQPHPLETSHVALPGSLLPLLEQLAENTHEVWASQRIKEGWTSGPKPCVCTILFGFIAVEFEDALEQARPTQR